MYNRIILSLLVDETHIYLSRRFKKQKFCRLEESNVFLEIDKMAAFCDEMSIVYVGNNNSPNIEKIIYTANLSKLCVPITIGGNIRSISDVKQALKVGSDKVMLSTSLLETPNIVKDISLYCGEQSIVYPLQLSYNDDTKKIHRWGKRGSSEYSNIELDSLMQSLRKLPIGEIYLIDIEADGRGGGYNHKLYNIISSVCNKPIILGGGDGKIEDIYMAMQEGVKATTVSNLFAFIGDGIKEARLKALKEGINLAYFQE